MRVLAWIGLAGLIAVSCAHKERKLCDNITLKEGDLKLGANERVIVCGSQKGGEGWKDVPLPQAQYHIKVLLQEEGYLEPRFERNGDQLNVWSGPRSLFKDLKVTGADGLLKGSKKRKIIGYPITPDKLDELNQWAETDLRGQGFACPKIDVKTQTWDGVALVDVLAGERGKVANVKLSGLESLNREALDRYMAFEPGDRYDVRETQVTIARLTQDALIQSAYFTAECRGDEVDLHLRADLGKPRLFRFGIGASTEQFPFVDMWFKNTKLDDKASSLTALLHASPIAQSLDMSADLYILPWSDRTFLGPRLLIKRRSEKFIEELSAKTGVDVGRNWDIAGTRLRGRFGPTLNYVNTVQGKGPDDVSFLSWEGHLKLMSHLYEVGTFDQYEGWEANLEYDGQREKLASYINADRYELNFKHLWNLGSYSPPLFVLGTRTQLAAVNTSLDGARLPSEYRVFLGGDENLRGFARNVLNNRDLGYITAAYLGLELRLVEQLPFRLQPFLLYDVAKTGAGRFRLDDPVFTSWGLGLRWASPFGVLRFSAARGEIYHENPVADSYPQEWVYFVSFGREF